jgi:hypothetical protein
MPKPLLDDPEFIASPDRGSERNSISEPPEVEDCIASAASQAALFLPSCLT